MEIQKKPSTNQNQPLTHSVVGKSTVNFQVAITLVVVAGLVARGGTETAAFPHTNGDDATFEEKELASEGALKARVMDTAAIASTATHTAQSHNHLSPLPHRRAQAQLQPFQTFQQIKTTLHTYALCPLRTSD